MDQEHLPDDVEGLERIQADMIQGALQIQNLQAKEIQTDFSKVYVLAID